VSDFDPLSRGLPETGSPAEMSGPGAVIPYPVLRESIQDPPWIWEMP